MLRFLLPLFTVGVVTGLLWLGLLLFVPPVHPVVVAAFLILLGLSLASFTSLGLYYLRRIWGPKDSPRLILRTSLKSGFFLSLGMIGVLLLQLFGAANLASLFILIVLVVLMERLT